MYISPDLSWPILEEQLLQDLQKVIWIGELPVERSDFENLAYILRRGFTSNGKPEIEKVRPALLITSMVFSARYSQDKDRNFWTPYATQVWGLKEAGQAFQNNGRSSFQACASYLRKNTGLSFPRQRLKEVVRPVYRHAIIPAYLEDDFADWLVSKRSTFLELGSSAAQALIEDPSVRYLAPTLQSFLQSEETAETARALVRDMATVADLYLNQGEEGDDINVLLEYSTIRRDLWKRLQQALEKDRSRHTAARRATRGLNTPRVEWLWLFEQEDMGIRVRDLFIESATRPNQLVWLGKEQDPTQATYFEPVFPYSQGQGKWLVDEAILLAPEDKRPSVSDGLVVLGEDLSIQESLGIPVFKPESFMLFRLTQQHVYGVEVDYRNKPVADGFWAVSMDKNVTLLDEAGTSITPWESLEVPRLLQQYADHASAGIYEFEFPVTVKIGEQSYIIDKQVKGVGSIALYGEAPVFGLSPHVPPTFTTHKVWLRLSHGDRRLVELGRLVIRSQVAAKNWPLKDLEKQGYLVLLEDGQLTIALEHLLPSGPAVSVIEIYQDLYSVTPSPLQVAVLPGVLITSPDAQTIYGPNYLPAIELSGILPEQIVSDSAIDLSHDSGTTRVVWRDLSQPCRLRLMIGDEGFILAWDIKRVAAWLEREDLNTPLTSENVLDAFLNLQAPREHRQAFLWLEGSEAKRQIDLGARGHYRNRIRDDQLRDMIVENKQETTVVWATLAGQSIEVARLYRTPIISSPQVDYEQGTRQLTFGCSIEFEWPGDFLFKVSPLANPDLTIPIGQLNRLATRNVLDCHLGPGQYQLSIQRSGVPLNLSPAHMLFTVGEHSTTGLQTSAGSADRLSSAGLRVPGNRGVAFLHAMIANESVGNLSGTQIFQLVTLPGATLAALPEVDRQKLWPPLHQLAIAQDSSSWESAFGLLPAWAVMNETIRITSPRFEDLDIVVYPEKALLRGRRGIGKAEIVLDSSEVREAYVNWFPGKRHETLVRVATLDEPVDPSTLISEIDDEVLASVFQCAICGQLVSYKTVARLYQAAATDTRHLHNRGRRVLIDTLNCDPIVVTVHREPGRSMPDLPTPDQSIALRDLRTPIPRSDNPIASATYLHAMQQWLATYHKDENARVLLDGLVSDASFRLAISHLSESHVISHSGYFAAAKRLLTAFKRRKSVRREPPIDLYALSIAILVRGIAYRPHDMDPVLRKSSLGDATLAYMLEVLWFCSPALLTWALVWAELFHQHSVS